MAGQRDRRQEAVLRWATSTFGVPALSIEERISRLLEEAIELAQAEGFSPERAHALIDHVYTKAPGEPVQEAGGVGVTLLAYCATAMFSADEAEALEFGRVLAIAPSHFRQRQNVKADNGVAVRVDE